MAREIFISIYLFIFRITFNLLKLLPQKEKTTFVASFGDNAYYVIQELVPGYDGQVIVLKTRRCRLDFSEFSNVTELQFESMNLVHFFLSIYHLATSKVVFVDNYFGCLSVMKFKVNVVCVQLWHAAGAIKKFALQDPSISTRSKRALKRFKDVYKRFDYVIVGSEKMANIFQASFGLQQKNMLQTGIPRTDFFYDRIEKKLVVDELTTTYPVIKDKKVILYAPTFRDGQLSDPEIDLNIKQMYESLHEEYVLFLKLHPVVQVRQKHEYEGFIYDVSSYPDINHLLLIADILISDYSSIPFEYALLDKPMIFHAYDLEPYSFSRGFWEDYKSSVPGPVTKDTLEIIDVIKKNEFDFQEIRNFSKNWNVYSYGNSSKNVISAVYSKNQSLTKIRDSQASL